MDALCADWLWNSISVLMSLTKETAIVDIPVAPNLLEEGHKREFEWPIGGAAFCGRRLHDWFWPQVQGRKVKRRPRRVGGYLDWLEGTAAKQGAPPSMPADICVAPKLVLRR